mmetsp:Transcript_26852/g.52726  ORF Transcript_26852/g.52726 Transcript_26852/m.52726 type:complete len:97 (-) Transcript_26852:1246-1536(-)
MNHTDGDLSEKNSFSLCQINRGRRKKRNRRGSPPSKDREKEESEGKMEAAGKEREKEKLEQQKDAFLEEGWPRGRKENRTKVFCLEKGRLPALPIS